MRKDFGGYSLLVWFLVTLSAFAGALAGWLFGRLPPGDYYPEP